MTNITFYAPWIETNCMPTEGDRTFWGLLVRWCKSHIYAYLDMSRWWEFVLRIWIGRVHFKWSICRAPWTHVLSVGWARDVDEPTGYVWGLQIPTLRWLLGGDQFDRAANYIQWQVFEQISRKWWVYNG